MLKIQKFVTLLFMVSALAAGCGEIVTYPDAPVISYKSFSLYKTTDALGNSILLGQMELKFTDGDGDVGLTQPDSLASADSLKYDFFTSLHAMKNGVFDTIGGAVGKQNFRIPYITREGQNKTLKGSITIDFEYKLIEYDTIFYTFYMQDRAFHKSNVDTSEVIVFTGLNF
jgi:hypothetical protein